jgi:hypothetical protein
MSSDTYYFVSLLYREQQSNLQKARKDLNDNFFNSLFIFN